MKNLQCQKGITIISLVVTIIILIILAGISINLTIGQDGLITKAKQAKENMELAQIEEQTHLNELYSDMEIGASGELNYDAIAKLAEFKTTIADYIGEAGGIKPEYTADTLTFGESIKGIVAEVTKNATATADDIAKDKTAYVSGQLLIGTGENMKQELSKNAGLKLYEGTAANNVISYTSTVNAKVIIYASGVRCTGGSNIPTCTMTQNGTTVSWDIYKLQSSSNGGQTAYNRYAVKTLDIAEGDSMVFNCYCNWFINIYAII